MYEILIKTDNLHDVDVIKDVLEGASEEGEIVDPFELRYTETDGMI